MIDLRSDTVTQPTPAMRQAIAQAVVGDDYLDGDPTTRQLEGRVAALLHAEQPLLERRRELPGTQRQRGRMPAEGVDQLGTVGAGQAVMQREEGAGLDAIHLGADPGVAGSRGASNRLRRF